MSATISFISWTLLTFLTSCFAAPVPAPAPDFNLTNIIRRPAHLNDILKPGYGKWGDMILPLDFLTRSETEGDVISFKQSRWPGATIPYVIDASLSGATNQIEVAIEEYHSKTCVRFVERTKETNYIRIFAGQGCYSYIGLINRGAQEVSLGQGCLPHGTIVHELGHAVGFYHEQNRSDRDNYLIIHWENIQQGMANQFAKVNPSQEIILTPFDVDSIMLYGSTSFSKDGRSKTMEAKNGHILREVYDKLGLSADDVDTVNKMYNC